MTIGSYIVGQFKKPHGIVGRLAGWIMVNRPSNRERNSWTVNLLAIKPDERVLEIGCGPGYGLELCAGQLTDGSIVGIDHSATMLDQARRRNRRHIDNGIASLLCGGLECLASLPYQFDKIFSANVAQFFPDKTQAFALIFNATAPGGTVASTFQPRSKNATREIALDFAADIKKNMETAGFKKIRIEELPLQPVPAVCILGVRPVA